MFAMKMKKLATALPVLLLCVATPVSAADMSFSTVAYTDAGISTSGALVGALNPVADATINTVPFAALTDPNAGPLALSGTVTLSIFGDTSNHTGPAGGGAGLLSDFAFDATVPVGNGALTFAGLTDGQQYQLQLVMFDSRNFGSEINIWGDQTDKTGAADVSENIEDVLSADPPDPSDEGPKLITATFTADGTTQSLYTQLETKRGFVGMFDGHFNALQLREIPEPSSVALFGLGALCLGVLGGRQKKTK